MAEHWRAGNGKSVRQCARMVVGIQEPGQERAKTVRGTKEPRQEASLKLPPAFSDCIAGKGSLDSKAKRLERLFHKVDHEGVIRPVSVYRTRDMARHTALHTLGSTAVFGPFYNPRLKDPEFREADQRAAEITSQLCAVPLNEVDELSAKGLKKLREWFPDDYPSTRI